MWRDDATLLDILRAARLALSFAVYRSRPLFDLENPEVAP